MWRCVNAKDNVEVWRCGDAFEGKIRWKYENVQM